MSDLHQVPDLGQRWIKWRNRHAKACPPWAILKVTDLVAPNETEVLFDGTQLFIDGTFDPTIPQDFGIPWNAAFNNEQAVEPGEVGLLTFDLPTWCMIQPSMVVGDFATYTGNLQQWSLQPAPSPFTLSIDPRWWNGLQVLATRAMDELTDIWNEREPGMLGGGGAYKIGLVGGLDTSPYGRVITTTTAAPPQCGIAVMVWSAGNGWFVVENRCIDGCSPPTSMAPASYDGEFRIVSCTEVA